MNTVIILATLAVIAKIGQSQTCPCPANWVYREHNNRCYFTSTGTNDSVTDTYQGARDRCHGDGGDLVIIDDALEVKYVKSIRKTSPTYYWIGACRRKGQPTFVDLNGNVFNPKGVLRGSLSAPQQYDEVAVMTAADRWTDAKPTGSNYYVCKKVPCLNSIRPDICPLREIEPKTSVGTTQSSILTKTAITTTDYITSSMTYNVATTGNDEETMESTTYLFIEIGVGITAFLVLLLVVLVIVIILLRNRKKRKDNGVESLTNNMDMNTTGTNKSVPINRKSAETENTARTNKAIYEECGYAEVGHRPDNTASDKAMTAKDVVYEDAVAVHIGVASKQDNNDVALYATPVRAKRTVDKKNGGDSSEEDHTEIVENVIYGE